MCKLLEQMKQCLYELKHAKPTQQMQIRDAIADTEITHTNLIRITEQCEEEEEYMRILLNS